jgi:hypothetical protein
MSFDATQYLKMFVKIAIKIVEVESRSPPSD